MTIPFVSVKMITYNHQSYIRKAIESVLAQKTNFPFELIIGEDCSTDGTREIVFNYARRNPDIIRVSTSEINVGAKQNSLRANQMCRGKYIAFCEGDDYWHDPEKLQKQIDFLEKNINYGMVISDCNILINQKNKVNESFNFKNGITNSKDLTLEEAFGFKKLHVFTCSAVIRKTIFDNLISSDPLLHQSKKFLMGDIQIWIELVLTSKVYYMTECFATYRVLAESASFSNDQLKMIKFWLSAAEVHLHICRKYKLPNDILTLLTQNKERLLFRLAFYEKNKLMALELKNKMISKNFKNYIYYFGTKNNLLNAVGIILLNIIYQIKKKSKSWG